MGASPGLARPSKSMAIVAALIVLATAAGFLIALAPVATCPNCLGTGRVDGDTDMWWHFLEHGPDALVPTKIMDHLTVTCDRCAQRGKVSLFNRWSRPKPKKE
jgi:hypothetical protein